ncbi:Uncharacterised protein [Shigella sonnei]|nr:Uncharacterised protein [Shigella sonnei]
MKRRHYRQVDVIVTQCTLPGGVISSEAQVVMGNHHTFRSGGGAGGEENFRRIVSR